MYQAKENQILIVKKNHDHPCGVQLLAAIKTNKGDWSHELLKEYAEQYDFEFERLRGDFVTLIPNTLETKKTDTQE